MPRKILLLMVCLFLACMVQGKSQSGDYEKSLAFGGRTRTYLLHLPAKYDEKTSMPLVIVLHGGGGNAAGTVRVTGMNAKADKEGFIVVYPNGTGKFRNYLLTWNAGKDSCGYAYDNNVDDVGFIRVLINELEKKYAIDPKRIYATGISNGGMMTYRLGCELSDKLAAIAPVAGALNCDSKPKNPVSVIIFHGMADLHVLYQGGHGLKQVDKTRNRLDRSVAYAASFWTKHNGCSQTPKKTGKGSAMIETYTGGKSNTKVVVYLIKGEGHTWPGGNKWAPWADDPSREISATDLMWDFFKNHPKP